jgi:hypothetical protein
MPQLLKSPTAPAATATACPLTLTGFPNRPPTFALVSASSAWSTTGSSSAAYSGTSGAVDLASVI